MSQQREKLDATAFNGKRIIIGLKWTRIARFLLNYRENSHQSSEVWPQAAHWPLQMWTLKRYGEGSFRFLRRWNHPEVLMAPSTVPELEYPTASPANWS